MHEIPIPPDTPESAREVIRIWRHDGRQYITLEITITEDPNIWGLVLADLMRHVSSAYLQAIERAQIDGRALVIGKRITRGEIEGRILDMFARECEHPTDDTIGHLQPQPKKGRQN